MKIGGIIEHILDLRIVNLLLWYLFKPIVLNAVKCKGTIVGKLTQPPDGATLGNPESEPGLTAEGTVKFGFPGESSLTVQAFKALFVRRGSAPPDDR